jgi:uncharacterized protein
MSNKRRDRMSALQKQTQAERDLPNRRFKSTVLPYHPREDSLDIFLNMSPAQAAAFNIGLLVILMLALKLYVGARRRTLKLASGDTSPDFNRAVRVQLNAVEDVPALMVGIGALAALGMPAWYIHTAGLTLVVARAAHAFGLAGSGGFSWGRLLGTLGTYVVALAIAGALLVHAFTPTQIH